jgi:hypothetical protein
MIKRSSALFVFLLLILSGTFAQAQTSTESPETQAVRKCFESYLDAISTRDGRLAATLINREMVSYYARMKAVALEGSEQTVRNLSTFDKFVVLSLRHRIPVTVLQNLEPQAVYGYGIEHGWTSGMTKENAQVGKIEVTGDKASGELRLNGEPTPYAWYFTKEEGHWRMDLSSLMLQTDKDLKLTIQAQRADEDSFIVNLLEAISGRKVSPEIWKPLIKAPAVT